MAGDDRGPRLPASPPDRQVGRCSRKRSRRSAAAAPQRGPAAGVGSFLGLLRLTVQPKVERLRRPNSPKGRFRAIGLKIQVVAVRDVAQQESETVNATLCWQGDLPGVACIACGRQRCPVTLSFTASGLRSHDRGRLVEHPRINQASVPPSHGGHTRTAKARPKPSVAEREARYRDATEVGPDRGIRRTIGRRTPRRRCCPLHLTSVRTTQRRPRRPKPGDSR